jgi:hypothetical protein
LARVKQNIDGEDIAGTPIGGARGTLRDRRSYVMLGKPKICFGRSPPE